MSFETFTSGGALGVSVDAALFTSGFEFLVAVGKDGVFESEQFVGGRDVAQGAVQANRVVMLHELGDEPACVVERERDVRPNALVF